MTLSLPNSAAHHGAHSAGVACGAPVSGAEHADIHAVRRIVRNSTVNLLGQGLLAVFHLVVVFLLARALGKDGVGVYYTYFAWIYVVQLICEAGLSTILTCRIARNTDRWQATAAEATALFSVVAALSAGVFVFGGVALAWLQGDAAIMWWSFAAGITCAAIQVQRFAAAIFRSFEQFGLENFCRVLQGAQFLAFVMLLVYLQGATVAAVLAAFAASHVTAAVVLVCGLQRCWHCLGWRLDHTIIHDWFAEAIPLGAGDVVRRLTWQLDTVLLSVLQPAAVVGIYSVAYRPLGPLNWLPQAVLNAMFPSLARMAQHDRPGLGRAFAHSIRLMWIVSLPLAVTICLAAEPLINVLAGPDFHDAAAPMRWLIWVVLLSFLSMHFRFLFTAVGQQRLFARLVVMVFLLEAGIEMALIPHWGYLGACIGTLLGELLFTVAGLYLCRRLGFRELDWAASIWSTIAAAITAVPVWLGRNQPPLALAAIAVAGMSLYLLLSLWSGALHRDELSHFMESVTHLLIPTRPFLPSAPAGAQTQAGSCGELPVALHEQRGPRCTQQ